MLTVIFKACAALLPTRFQKCANPQRHYLTFSIDGIRFGIDIRMASRIVRYGIPAVPRGTPAFLRGFLRHEGEMIPILDIAARYGNHPQQPGGRTCLIVVELGHGRWRTEIGVMVEEVLSVAACHAGEVCAVPDVAHKLMRVGIVEGLVRQGEEHLILLDPMRLLPDDELQALMAYKQQTWPPAG